MSWRYVQLFLLRSHSSHRNPTVTIFVFTVRQLSRNMVECSWKDLFARTISIELLLLRDGCMYMAALIREENSICSFGMDA